jgi:hypothetical protein
LPEDKTVAPVVCTAFTYAEVTPIDDLPAVTDILPLLYRTATTTVTYFDCYYAKAF